MAEKMPSIDAWLKEAQADPSAPECGMYLTHVGVVRRTAREKVRQGLPDTRPVRGMWFDYYEEKVAQATANARKLPGIGYVRVWLNQGELAVGDPIMLVLVGGDIRPHVIRALQDLVGTLKENCVIERERHEP